MEEKKGFLTSKRSDGRWVVKNADSKRVKSFHDSQSDAWREARRLARGSGSGAYLEGKEGKIFTSNVYILTNNE